MSNIKARETANTAIELFEAKQAKIEGLLKKVKEHLNAKVKILKVGKGVASGKRMVLLSVDGKTKVQYL